MLQAHTYEPQAYHAYRPPGSNYQRQIQKELTLVAWTWRSTKPHYRDNRTMNRISIV